MTTRRLMTFGASPELAKEIVKLGDVSSGLTATGTNFATALQLTTSVNFMGTVAASTGVKFPSLAVGEEIVIKNGGASTLTVYPYASTQNIDGSASASINAAATKRFIRRNSTRFDTI